MGTPCHIGIEYDDDTVEYIYLHFDGYFDGIVPTLLHYIEREDVKTMIRHGFCEVTDLPEHVDDTLYEDPPKTIRGIYELKRISHTMGVGHIYVFSRNNEWLCYTDDFFGMKRLYEHYIH